MTESDPTSEQTLRLIESSGTLDFWDEPSEDVYRPYECSTCGGSGKRLDINRGAERGDPARKWLTCRTCNGTGVVWDGTVVQPVYAYDVHAS